MHSLFYRRTFQLVTAAILGYALYRILEPLRGVIGWAAVLAFILYPLQERLTRRLRGRRALAAGILTALTPFFVFVPLSVLGVVFAGQVARMIDYLRGHSLLELQRRGSSAWRTCRSSATPWTGCARTPRSASAKCRAGSATACRRC